MPVDMAKSFLTFLIRFGFEWFMNAVGKAKEQPGFMELYFSIIKLNWGASGTMVMHVSLTCVTRAQFHLHAAV